MKVLNQLLKWIGDTGGGEHKTSRGEHKTSCTQLNGRAQSTIKSNVNCITCRYFRSLHLVLNLNLIPSYWCLMPGQEQKFFWGKTNVIWYMPSLIQFHGMQNKMMHARHFVISGLEKNTCHSSNQNLSVKTKVRRAKLPSKGETYKATKV